MRKRINFATLLLFPCFFMVSQLDQIQNMKSKGKAKDNHEVKTINNSGSPLYGEIRLDLKKETSIGREDDPNYLFYRVRGVDVDNEGNIFVNDMSNYRIQKFDGNGKYLQTIGRRGQGPSEFQMPMHIKIDDITGNILVLDYSLSIVIFNNRGEYVRTYHLNRLIDDFVPNDDGTIMANLVMGYEKKKHSLCKINSAGEISNIYFEFSYPMYARITSGGEHMMTTGYEFSLHFSKIDKRTIVFGYSKDYELSVIDRDGNLLYRIRKEVPIPRFTPEERSELNALKKRIPQFELPQHKPYFFKILTDSKGRIYIQLNKAKVTIRGYGPTDKEEKVVDVFSKDGYFLHKTTLPPNTCVIKDGFLYAYKVAEERGLEYVQKFKIKNWDQMKE